MFDSSIETSTTGKGRLESKGARPHLVTQVSIRIRSMGTATFLAIGGGDRQEFRLTTTGQILDIEVMPNHRCKPYFDLGDLYQVSDTGDLNYELLWENHEESENKP